MSNELSAAFFASIITFVLSGISSCVKSKIQSKKSIKKAKTYINDELNIIHSTLTEIDNVLSNNGNPPIQKIQSLVRFIHPSEALKNQIVELPNEDIRRKINIFYNDLFHAVNIDFSRLYSLGNEQDQSVINERSDIKSKFKELLKAIEDIKSGLKT